MDTLDVKRMRMVEFICMHKLLTKIFGVSARESTPAKLVYTRLGINMEF